jgi:hypothetical protein
LLLPLQGVDRFPIALVVELTIEEPIEDPDGIISTPVDAIIEIVDTDKKPS